MNKENNMNWTEKSVDSVLELKVELTEQKEDIRRLLDFFFTQEHINEFKIHNVVANTVFTCLREFLSIEELDLKTLWEGESGCAYLLNIKDDSFYVLYNKVEGEFSLEKMQ